MSKHGKDLTQNGRDADLTIESGTAGNDAEPMRLHSATQSQLDGEQTERSRQFNSWLDRTMPRLMQLLGSPAGSAVTSPGTKPKH